VTIRSVVTRALYDTKAGEAGITYAWELLVVLVLLVVGDQETATTSIFGRTSECAAAT
jgi:hypothetical protein